MAEKISTLILKVDLDCHHCYKKIRKTLCKLQDRENIRAIAYDEKNKTVTISGPFDPHKLSKKLYCKACKVIKDIQVIKESKEKPKDPKPAETKKEKPKDQKPDEPAKPEKETKPKDPKPAETAEPKKEKPKTDPAPEPVRLSGPVCSCRPWYEWYYGDFRCRWCGRGYGCVPVGPPVVYGGPSYGGYKTCQFYCEEDPQSSCVIM